MRDDVVVLDETFKQRQLWKIVVSTGVETQLTSGDSTVKEYVVSADGKRIALQRAPAPGDGDAYRGEVWVMDANGENAARPHQQLDRREVCPTLSPDGSQVLFLADMNERFEPYYPTNLFIVRAAGGAPRLAAAGLHLRVRSGRVDAGRPVDPRDREHGRAHRVLQHRRRGRRVPSR